MDYDDSDAHEQNLHLTGEGSSKVSPVLHSYPLPKFDFDDNLQEHLRFDSLVENEVFLGITSQEDNQWIEEYSRGTSAIPFNSSVAESRNQNVWFEATSSESVEMLLKSVGQEEKVLEETMTEELDPNLQQCGENDPEEFQENFVGSKVSDDGEQSLVTFTSQSQETQISHGGLDSVVVDDKNGLSFDDQNVDKTRDDANQQGSSLANEMQEDLSVSKVDCEITGSLQNVEANQEGSDLANESLIELQEDSYVSKVECGNAGSSQNVNASVKVLETDNENASDISKNFHSSEPEHIDNVCDDANEEGSNLENELQEDLSVSKVEGGIAGSPQNADASVEECHENPQEVLETPNENTSDLSQNLNSCEPGHIDKIHDDGTEMQEDSSVSKVEDASVGGCHENESASDLSKKIHSSELEHVDKVYDDASQKGSDLGSESFVNELQEDHSVTMVECGNAGASQNMDASIEECQHNPQEVLETVEGNASDLNFHSSDPEHINKIPDDANQEGSNLASESPVGKLQEDPSVSMVENAGRTSIAASSSAEMAAEDILSKDEGGGNNAPNQLVDETQSLEPDAASIDQDFTFTQRGDERDSLDSKDMDIDVVSALDSQKNAEPSSSGNNAPNIDTEETQSSEPDAVCMDQDFTFNEKGDTTLPLEFKDTDMDVDRASDNQKNVEPSLSAEVCEETIVIAQESQPNMPLLPNVADMESSKTSSETQEADIVTEDQPRSPILGVSLLHDANEEKVEVGGSFQKATPEADSALGDSLPSGTVARADIDTENQPKSPTLGVGLLQNANERKEEVGGSFQKGTPEVDSALDASLPVVKKDADYSHGDLPVGSCDVGPSEQTVDDNTKPLETSSLPCDSSTEVANKSEAGGLLDPKESVTGEAGVEPLNSTVNISDEQQASVVVAGPSDNENAGGSASLNKPQVFSFSDTKTIEPSQMDKHEVIKNTPLSKITNEVHGLQSVSSTSAAKEEKSFTFEVIGQTGAQNLDFSKVSSVSSSGVLLDSTKPLEGSLVSPQKPSVAPSESGAKKTTERKPRRKSVGKETAKKGSHLKETTPTRRSGSEKSPALLNFSTTGPNESQPDLNKSTSLLHQSFTDNQQVQLRAQILVYGSLISGMSPEESHMIAAFGQSDSGRKAWEAVWHACIERVHSHKSPINNPQTPLQTRSGNRDTDQETKIDSTQSKVLSTPIITGTIVSPMNPIPSPLWNISTPHDRLQPGPTPRSPLFDLRQTLSPLHPFQPQRVQTFSGHNPPWPSQMPFPGQWVASSPVSPFNARFSSLPITEAVKLTTVKESGASGIPITPVEHAPGPIVSPIMPSSIPHMKNTSGQPSNDPKSRKRKKVTDSVGLNQTPVSSPTPVAFSTPVSVPPKTNLFLSALSPGSTHSQPINVDQNMQEKTVNKVENLSKIEESKLQATKAAEQAAVAVSHCQDVWRQMERQKSSGLVSDDEAKLASSAVSIAAAASVAKVAAFAAKIASNVAEQARLMADEVFLSSQPESHKSKSDHSASVISVAKEAARKRIEAASAASKHAENLDAIVKAAELAAEAVSQAGKIVSMGKPLPLSELVEAGPEGYWKTPQASNKQIVGGGVSSDKKIQTLKHGLSLQGHFGDLAKNPMMITTAREGLDLSKTIGVVPELEIGPSHTSNADVDIPQSTSPTWKDTNFTEGCLVEVYKDGNKNKGAWFAANVLTLKDGKAFVCYTEILSDEGSGKLKEWVPLEAEGTEAPRIRIAHPMTTLQFEGTKKRGRTVLKDYSWCSGDHVDVWVQDSWHEAVVVETNKIDLTSLTVQFPAQGKTSIVRSWHVRPTLIYKDGKWIEWSSFKASRSSEGDTPQEKRQKFDKEKDKSWLSIDLEAGRHQESRIPTFSTQKISFDIGKSYFDDNKQKSTRGPIRSGGLQKERSRVVFGVPKPGKKQKFMDVSRHYVGDGSNKNNNNNATPINPVKKIFVNESKEKQAAEVKSKAPRFRKPPVPTLARSKSSVSDNRNVKDSVSVDGNMPGQQKEMGGGGSSSNDVENTPKQTLASKVASERLLNKRKLPSGNGKPSKVEVKESLTSEAEPRRSNRKIQPTSRLLEGLQSSLTISKMPTVSHASQRSHNKAIMPKGSPRPG